MICFFLQKENDGIDGRWDLDILLGFEHPQDFQLSSHHTESKSIQVWECNKKSWYIEDRTKEWANKVWMHFDMRTSWIGFHLETKSINYDVFLFFNEGKTIWYILRIESIIQLFSSSKNLIYCNNMKNNIITTNIQNNQEFETHRIERKLFHNKIIESEHACN